MASGRAPNRDCLFDGRPVELQVVRRTSGDEAKPTERFHLDRMPQEGPLHRPACFFHETDHAVRLEF